MDFMTDSFVFNAYPGVDNSGNDTVTGGDGWDADRVYGSGGSDRIVFTDGTYVPDPDADRRIKDGVMPDPITIQTGEDDDTAGSLQWRDASGDPDATYDPDAGNRLADEYMDDGMTTLWF